MINPKSFNVQQCILGTHTTGMLSKYVFWENVLSAKPSQVFGVSN